MIIEAAAPSFAVHINNISGVNSPQKGVIRDGDIIIRLIEQFIFGNTMIWMVSFFCAFRMSDY